MLAKTDIEQKYRDLLESYLNVKPILANLYRRNGNRYVYGIMNEIRALNDHIAQCYRDGASDEQVFEELCKAEGHLKRLIYDCFKQLNIIFYDYANDYEKTHFGSHWIALDDGRFWNEYSVQRLLIVQSIEAAKEQESQDIDAAFEKYQDAYVAQEKVYDLLNQNKNSLERGLWAKVVGVVVSNKNWFCTTVALSIIPVAIWEIVMRANVIWGWCVGFYEDVVHTVGGFLLGL